MDNRSYNRRNTIAALICGVLGCLCFGAGDWLMIYGDTSYEGTLSWLTKGAAQIAPWRNALAMALAFPGIVFYGIALFAIAQFLHKEKQKRVYHYLTVFSLTPWLSLHLFYIFILYVFSWMNGNGYEALALPTAQAMFYHLSWIVPVSEAMMLPPYIYFFYLLVSGKSVFPKAMAFLNPLVFYGLLKLATGLMPEGALRLAFTNGLMSESMAIWFICLIVWSTFKRKKA